MGQGLARHLCTDAHSHAATPVDSKARKVAVEEELAERWCSRANKAQKRCVKGLFCPLQFTSCSSTAYDKISKGIIVRTKGLARRFLTSSEHEPWRSNYIWQAHRYSRQAHASQFQPPQTPVLHHFVLESFSAGMKNCAPKT